MNKQIVLLIMLLGLFGISRLNADETAFCVDAQQEVAKSSAATKVTSISPSLSDSYALQIYVTFPDVSGQDDLPNYYTDIETNIRDFFDEMSYNAHHVHLGTAIRPSPNQTKCYVADHNVSYYLECFRSHSCSYKSTGGLVDLTTEILQKVYNDDNNAFVDKQMVFINVTGNIFAHHSAYSSLGSHSFAHY